MLGLPFDAVDMPGAVRQVCDAVAARTPCFLSTPNVNFLVGCLSNVSFRLSVFNSDLSVADGMPLVWAARLLGIPIAERVAGSSLFEQLKSNGPAQLSVYFFGGQEGVAEAACRRLNAESSRLTCVGFYYPGFGTVEAMSTEEIIAGINAAKPDFIVVSLGAGKGQAWIERNRSRLSAPVISHLGAVVNFIAGEVSRAPPWMQRHGLEWLWRIKEEPGLWRRYAADGLVLLRLLVTRVLPHAWFIHRHKPPRDVVAAAVIRVSSDTHETVIELQGAWVVENLRPLRERLSEAIRSGMDVRIDLGQVSYVDTAFVGLMLLLYGHQTRHGRQLQLVAPTETVRRIIAYCCAECLQSPCQ
jgi:N-acetylglucosaminyldiphosphoundecaprenol N-acetyl-beta-D-mannosaminyltransferase